MKSITRYFIPCALMAFVACNSGEDKVETKNTTQETTTTTPETTTPKEEPKKTSISVGPGGASVDTKKGTSVKVDSSGVKLGTKDVNITVNPKKKN
jgi:ABC-type enterochelin transport system substrate-binding protein